LEVGSWKMEVGRWEMEDGRWKMEDGRWEMGDGRKMTDSICHSLGISKYRNKKILE